MPRLFRKFFAIIWLTLAASVGTTMLIVYLIQVSPPKFERQKRELILTLTENILKTSGEDAALGFVRASEDTVPLGLNVSKSEDGDCAHDGTEETGTVLKNGTCYRVTASQRASLIADILPPLVLLVAIIVSSMISAAALARYLIRPVVHLRDGLSELAQGRFDVRIGEKMACRRDEITALAHDFDSTAMRLQEQQEAQQRLFHDVSHELRSPLSRLQAVAGILRKSPTKLDLMLDRMDREVERLDTLVGEVLTLARLTTRARLPLKLQTLDVIELLNEILSDAAFEAQAREVSITPEIDGTFLAEMEGELIYRALENVIRNAVKYTAEKSQVSVICETSTDALKVIIIDQGPGVSQDELEGIFQPFSRGTEVIPRGGYGLGLAIARRAIERHGGQVFASLPHVGGLAITLEIPRQSAMCKFADNRD